MKPGDRVRIRVGKYAGQTGTYMETMLRDGQPIAAWVALDSDQHQPPEEG